MSESWEKGTKWERKVSEWLSSNGNYVLEACRIQNHESTETQAPLIKSIAGKHLLAPDLLAFCGGEVVWVEVKFKSKAKRIGGVDFTGFEMWKLGRYQQVANRTGCPVFVVFVQRDRREILYATTDELFRNPSMRVEEQSPGGETSWYALWECGSLRVGANLLLSKDFDGDETQITECT